jgi:D-sedoheptulose 7-phosphate isomerase
MADPRQEAVLAHFRRSQQAVERAAADGKFVAATVAIAERIAAALKSGGKVLLAGNGGSAADAQHIAAEFVGRFVNDRAPLAAIALTTDTSALTAIGNDYGFDKVFERQVRALGRKGDVFVAISTSGRSPNTVAALQARANWASSPSAFTRDAQTRCMRCAIWCLAYRPKRPR